MTEGMKQIIKDLDNAVNLLSGVFNGLDNLEHSERDNAHDIYTNAEEMFNRLKEES